jgi:hypothetical protein
MRTTVTIDDDVYRFITLYSNAKGVSFGTAIGELVLRGQAASLPTSVELERAPNGLLVFASRGEGQSITPEIVKAAQDDEIE